ncbi:unnamed protein product, partial [Gulo gulo]
YGSLEGSAAVVHQQGLGVGGRGEPDPPANTVDLPGEEQGTWRATGGLRSQWDVCPHQHVCLDPGTGGAFQSLRGARRCLRHAPHPLGSGHECPSTTR